MSASDQVFKILSKSDKPLKGGEIADIPGLERKIVDKAIKELVKEEKIFSPRRCFYSAK